MKNILVCADDFGQNEAISAGILQLANNNRINAISCLVNMLGWQEKSTELHRLAKPIYLGLHFNLTDGQALSQQWRTNYSSSFQRLSHVIKQSYGRALHKHIIMAELQAQFDAFTEKMGFYPDFIDGHQHIHQLPMIREVVVDFYQQKKLIAFCRSTLSKQKFLSLSSFPKRQLISLLGGIVFKKLLREHTIPTNSSFAGIYNFHKAHNYQYYFKQFLKISDHRGLIMCHPGHQSADFNDPLYQYRHHEFNYLMSNDFLIDLKNEQCQLMDKPFLQ